MGGKGGGEAGAGVSGTRCGVSSARGLQGKEKRMGGGGDEGTRRWRGVGPGEGMGWMGFPAWSDWGLGRLAGSSRARVDEGV